MEIAAAGGNSSAAGHVPGSAALGPGALVRPAGSAWRDQLAAGRRHGRLLAGRLRELPLGRRSGHVPAATDGPGLLRCARGRHCPPLHDARTVLADRLASSARWCCWGSWPRFAWERFGPGRATIASPARCIPIRKAMYLTTLGLAALGLARTSARASPRRVLGDLRRRARAGACSPSRAPATPRRSLAIGAVLLAADVAALQAHRAAWRMGWLAAGRLVAGARGAGSIRWPIFATPCCSAGPKNPTRSAAGRSSGRRCLLHQLSALARLWLRVVLDPGPHRHHFRRARLGPPRSPQRLSRNAALAGHRRARSRRAGRAGRPGRRDPRAASSCQRPGLRPAAGNARLRPAQFADGIRHGRCEFVTVPPGLLPAADGLVCRPTSTRSHAKSAT